MEAGAEGQQEVPAHPQPFKILCKGAKFHKMLKRPGETDARDKRTRTTGQMRRV